MKKSSNNLPLEPWATLPDKVVLITGASSGLGMEFCLDLAKSGCRIVAAARRVDRLLAICNQVNSLASNRLPIAAAVELDVSRDGNSIDHSVQLAWNIFGRIDTLINNAGIRGNKGPVFLSCSLTPFLGEVASPLNLREEEWDRVIQTNLTGAWLVSKSVCSRMQKAKIEGSVINISSTEGLNRVHTNGSLPYASSKVGLNVLTKVMALELGGAKIRVNSICPGVFKSEITENLMKKNWLNRVAERTIPLGSFGTCDPGLTSLIRYLIHCSSCYVNGNLFIVDCGATLPGFPIFSSL